MPQQKKIRSAAAVDRRARIATIKAQLAAGSYETREKLEAALEAFLAGSRGPEQPPGSEPAPRLPR